MKPTASIHLGTWTITSTYLAAVGLAGVFVTALASTPTVSDRMRPFAIAFVVSFVLSVPIHEFGHVVVVRILGHRVDHVRVGLYSGVVWSASASVLSVRDVLLISAAGPSANLVVACGALLAALGSAPTEALLGTAAAMAVASVLDLVPWATRRGALGRSGEVAMSDGATILHAWRQRRV